MTTPGSVYLDYAATTPLDPRVLQAMQPYLHEEWGNPSSVYAPGRRARRALDQARDRIAQVLHCRANEVVFTSGGTEGDNLAVKGAALAARAARGARHVVTSAIEHHAVLHACQWLERYLDFEVTYLPVDAQGWVEPEHVARAVRPDTALVSIMLANNEIGTIQAVDQIAQVARRSNAEVLVHTDAVQAGGLLPLDLETLGVDLLTLSGHKFYAPKGVGLLYVRRGTPLVPLLSGGGQERELRAGTENIASIVGLAEALELAYGDLGARRSHTARLRDALIRGILERVRDTLLTGHPTRRMPNSASFVFPGADGESLLLNLDQEGVYASSGSACTSGSLEISHVLRAVGLTDEQSRGSLRLTTGLQTTDADVGSVLRVLPSIVARVREVTPLLSAA